MIHEQCLRRAQSVNRACLSNAVNVVGRIGGKVRDRSTYRSAVGADGLSRTADETVGVEDTSKKVIAARRAPRSVAPRDPRQCGGGREGVVQPRVQDSHPRRRRHLARGRGATREPIAGTLSSIYAQSAAGQGESPHPPVRPRRKTVERGWRFRTCETRARTSRGRIAAEKLSTPRASIPRLLLLFELQIRKSRVKSPSAISTRGKAGLNFVE